MANSSNVDRAQQKATAQRNRLKDVNSRARKAAKKRKKARAIKAASVETEPKKSPASS
jgi:hypothetical protein